MKTITSMSKLKTGKRIELQIDLNEDRARAVRISELIDFLWSLFNASGDLNLIGLKILKATDDKKTKTDKRRTKASSKRTKTV